MTAVQTDSEFQARLVRKPNGRLTDRFPLGRLKYLPTGLILVLGFCLSLLVFNAVVSENRNHIRQDFENTASRYMEIFRHSIDLNIAALTSIRSLFHASKSVERAEFNHFTAPMLTSLVGIQALEWIPRVAGEERTNYEQHAQQDGVDGFIFSERKAQGRMVPAGTRDEYFPVYYVEPLERNKVALGFDLGSSAKRLKALHLARDTGKAVATAPITLVQETGKQLAFLVFVPIYRLQSPVDSIETRRNNLIGFSLGVYRVGDMIKATLKKLRPSRQVDFYIFDVGDDADGQLLYKSDHQTGSHSTAPSEKELRAGIHAVGTLNVSGRIWEVVFKPTPGNIIGPIDFTAIATLLVGLILSGLITSCIWSASQRAEKAEELKEALAKEQKLSKLQREFVSMASHEFRTPLAIIDGTAQRMKSRADKNRLTPEDAVKRIEKIRAAVRRMTRLMESTLTAARMEEGKAVVDIEPCDLKTIVAEVCARQKEIAPEHIVSCKLADLLPETIQADPSALEQVLTNLLSNAVKYAPPASDINVNVFEDEDHVVICVRDHGLGIDENDLPRIFERYFRAKTSIGTAGTGIGLSLVKSLVEMHDGTVNVESRKGEGSTFTIRLPIAGPDQSERVKTRAA